MDFNSYNCFNNDFFGKNIPIIIQGNLKSVFRIERHFFIFHEPV